MRQAALWLFLLSTAAWSDEPARQPADKLDGPPLVTCKAWAVLDGKTGDVFRGQRENDPLDNASTTKMMTCFVILQQIADNPSVLDERVTFSQRAAKTAGTRADLKAGESTTVRELLYGLMLPSGNDASIAFAEHFGRKMSAIGNGNKNADPLQVFVAEMNRQAQALRLTNTRFANPHGLTSPGHRASARDLGKLAWTALKNPTFKELVNTRTYNGTVTTLTGQTRLQRWKTTNQLLNITGYDGVKTGTTEAAGACLVSTGTRGDDRLFVVILGSTTPDGRYLDARNLYRWAWKERGHKE